MDILIIAVAIVAAGLVVAIALMRAGANPLRDQVVSLADRVAMLSRLVDERLDQLAHRVGSSLTEQATKTAESFGQLTERLSIIDAAQKNLTELSGQVVGLQDILANKQARGAFGEIQLADIVTGALPPSAYDFQVTLSNRARADCVLKLPNPPGVIVIDAKFPLESFKALRDGDKAEREIAARAFRSDVLKHVTDIAERYILPGETAESALMFVPAEAVYAELHTNFVDVVQRSYAARVWIVSPTTLMATLNTVRAVLKDVRMREQAHVIQREVGKMAKDVERLMERVDKLQKHFVQAEGDIRDIGVSAGKIASTAERIEEVQVEADVAVIADPASNVTPLKGLR